MTDQGGHLYLLFSRICGGADLEDHGIVQQKIELYKEENKMQQSVLKVQELGAPPEGFESGKPSSKKAFRIWDEWMEAVTSIQKPVTWEEAEILIKCCPTDHMAGMEWTFLHCIESVCRTEETERYQALIEQCNSDMMKHELLKRLENSQMKASIPSVN